MSLRNAFGCSAALHLALIFSGMPAGFLPARPPPHTLEISYLPAPSVSATARPGSPSPALGLGAAVQDGLAAPPSRPASLSASLLPRVAREAVAARPARSLDNRPHPPAGLGNPVPSVPLKRVAEVAPVRSSVKSPVFSEQEFAFIEHKERVRRHLKEHLHYPSFLEDGTVRLRILLDPSGALKQASVLQSSDPRLVALALRDAQAAAPYPRFPGKGHPRRIHYEFLVRYKPE